METSEKVAAYFSKEHKFKKGIAVLRSLANKTEALETHKWSAPVYTIDNKNVFWISRFNNHFGMGFFNGIFLKDPLKILVNVQEGKTQAMRHLKFKTMAEIDEKIVFAYMKESLENQKKGMVLALKKKKTVKTSVPQLLKDALDQNITANKAFKNLSPYKQREYSEYILTAKQEKTKRTRLEKILPMISIGKGLNDKYIK